MRRIGPAFALLILLEFWLARPASAQGAPLVPPPTTVVQTQKAAAPAPEACVIPSVEDLCLDRAALPKCAIVGHPPKGNLSLSVLIDDAYTWRPQGGDVKFSLKGPGLVPAGADVAVCMGWKTGSATPVTWHLTPSLRLQPTTDTTTATFLATVPPLGAQTHSFWSRVFGPAPADVAAAWGLVPYADFRVVAKTHDGLGWEYLDLRQPLGVTSPFAAAFLALLFITVGLIVLFLVAQARNIPGSGRSVLLRIISTKTGYASLSQLQILLWAFVIGSSAIYVIGLSGNLIDLSDGTLVLLGISGVSTVGAKLQGQTNAALGTSATASPGPLATPAVIAPMGDSEAVLAWSAPPIGGTVDSYTVLYRVQGTPNWLTATESLVTPGFRVVNLNPNTPYEFQVVAVNSAGSSVSSSAEAATAPALPGVAVTGFQPSVALSNSQVQMIWTAGQPGDLYRVQYRVHDSDDDWTDAPRNAAGALANGLEAATAFDFRIAGAPAPPNAAAAPAYGPWTYTLVSTKGPRIPRWSDLVISSNGLDEIDVTRVQMLFFTVIVAVFVALKVISSSSIPEIPASFLTLMGISNSVYLGSKYIRG